LFVNSVIAKVPWFYSLFFQPGCLGVDALAFDWGGENCWLVPPVYLILRVLVHFLTCKSRGVLFAPFWPSSLFWPYLIQGNGSFKSFVVDFLFVQNGRDVFARGGNVRHRKSTGTRVMFYRCCPLGLWNLDWSTGTIWSTGISFFICSVCFVIFAALVGLYLFSFRLILGCQSSINLWGSFYGS